MKHRMKWWLAVMVVISIVVVAEATREAKALQQSHPEQAIPEQAIRLRVVANSDSDRDQRVKMAVRDALFMKMATWSERPLTLEQSRALLKRKLPELQALVAQTLVALDVNETFAMKLGAAEFPQKTYGAHVYPAGQYEALVITLGAGAGHNWWCVLFPQLCFEQSESTEEVRPNERYPIDPEPKVRLWIWEQLKSWFE
jgi:stage II sporulation protein R